MQKWLERGKDELEPTDEDVWGIAKSQYTFVDLGLWKKQGTLKDTRRSLPSPMSSGGIRRIPSGMSESAGFRRNSHQQSTTPLLPQLPSSPTTTSPPQPLHIAHGPPPSSGKE
ncbi:hypothetical protein K443DRAFT_13003 [Laccaria amethystina LaAM-08-1]|uniref:Uncharacterized protein n=1 Tax=Laccaria amethystina LaAM-08-1 TaxID=1095629 RepID=A0A0C9WIN1_9AGAR|nr:hypothetical protein K443DRAFT_13003 [Laccaria amethystina LaAM-08-1]